MSDATVLRVAAWYARPYFQAVGDGEGTYTVLILGAFGEAMQIVGTRESLLDFADRFRKAAEQAPAVKS